MAESDESGWRLRALLAARALVGTALAIGAALHLLYGRRHFERFGVPDAYRIGLGGAEILAGLLFAMPRTVQVGAAALLAVLAWAAGLHAGLREPSAHLYLWMLIVAVLAHVPSPFPSRSAGAPR